MSIKDEISRRRLLKTAGGLALVSGLSAPSILRAQSADVIRFGHLTPRTGFLGPLGEYGVMAADLAVEEINAAGGVMGRKVELLKEDSVNPQTASTKAERMIERDKVACIIGEISSASCLTIAQVASRNKTLFINTGGNSDALRGKDCQRYMFHVESQNSMYVKTVGRSFLQEGLVKGKKWYSLTADYAFGHGLQEQASRVVTENKGRVLGSVRLPVGTADFASALLMAQSSGAKVVALANAGNDTINSIKQAAQFGLTQGGQKLATLGGFINDVHGLGLAEAQGLTVTEASYWDTNDATRAWSKTFFDKVKAMPNMLQTGTYSSVRHYLKAVAAAKTDASAAVMDAMRASIVDDIFYRGGRIRPDGRMVHAMNLYEVKTPAESKAPWDYYKLLATTSGDQAFRPIEASTCALVNRR